MVIASPREPQEAGPGAEGLFQSDSHEEVSREECRAAVFDRLISKVKCVFLNTDLSCEGACCVLRCWPHLDNHLTFIYSAYPIV